MVLLYVGTLPSDAPLRSVVQRAPRQAEDSQPLKAAGVTLLCDSPSASQYRGSYSITPGKTDAHRWCLIIPMAVVGSSWLEGGIPFSTLLLSPYVSKNPVWTNHREKGSVRFSWRHLWTWEGGGSPGYYTA